MLSAPATKPQGHEGLSAARCERTAGIPIIRHVDVSLGSEERQKLVRLAGKVRSDQPRLSNTEPFSPSVKAGLGEGPHVVIEDHGAIQLIGRNSDLIYGHRALALAGDGDVVILEGGPNQAFADYYRDILGLGDVSFLSPKPATVPRQISLRCADDRNVVGALANLARRHGALNIVPYMGTGGAWRLAGAVAETSATPVRVAAPPPNLTQRVNDKLWFGRLLADVLGLRAAPPFYSVYGPAGLIACVRRLARDHKGVAVKLPSAAGGTGNVVLAAEEVLGTPPSELADRLVDLLHLGAGADSYPVMVCAWKKAVLAAPSVQTWIPLPEQGDPVIEGVFDQIVAGAEGTFAGAVPTTMDSEWVQRLGREAMSIAIVLQQLGYFGRCSFDLILVGHRDGPAEAYWIECNGRWGGVSLPMTLANRLTGDWMTNPFVVIDRGTTLGRPRPFDAVLEDVSDLLFRPSSSSGAVFLSPARIEQGTGLDAIALGSSVEAAHEAALRLVERLSGSGAA